MKYLNTYKLYEAFVDDEDIQIIKDILLEVTDIGYQVSIYKMTEYTRIIINLPYEANFQFDEIKDCVLRLKDYSGYRFTELTINYNYTSWDAVKLTDDVVISKPIHNACLWILPLSRNFAAIDKQ